jgi:hypothetical protein
MRDHHSSVMSAGSKVPVRPTTRQSDIRACWTGLETGFHPPSHSLLTGVPVDSDEARTVRRNRDRWPMVVGLGSACQADRLHVFRRVAGGSLDSRERGMTTGFRCGGLPTIPTSLLTRAAPSGKNAATAPTGRRAVEHPLQPGFRSAKGSCPLGRRCRRCHRPSLNTASLGDGV